MFHSRFGEDTADDLQDQIADLRREVATLTRRMSRQAGRAMSGVRGADFYDDLQEYVADALPALRRHARVVQDTARSHPTTTALVGLAVIGLAIGLMTRR